jgi:osmotically-inducible protein OsmY
MRTPSGRGWRRWLWLAGLAAAACGCNSQDVGCLAHVGRLTAAKLDGLTGGARGKLATGWEAVRGSWSDATLDSKVALRLRWDKALAGADVRVQAAGTGVVRLRGAVTDLGQRRRAVDLAQSTHGVNRVLDELTVQGE